MNSQTTRRMIALIACVLFIVAFLFTTSFIFEHAGHDCEGRDCSVCAQINSAENILKQLSSAIIGVGFIAGCFILVSLQIRHIILSAGLSTLVHLKVKMNN